MELAGLVIAFIVIVTMVMKKVNLGLAMLTGSVIIALTSPAISFNGFFELLRGAVFNSTTMSLFLVIINITIIAGIMDKTGLVDKMVGAMLKIFKRYDIILMLVPTILGIFAIPGGAMISAPMVNNISKGLNIDNTRKWAINMLYRHALYFACPYVPCLILASELSGVDVYTMISYIWPISVVMAVVGYFTLLRGLDNNAKLKMNDNFKIPDNIYCALKDLCISLLPILIGIILPIILPISFWLALTIGTVILLFEVRDKINFQLVLKSINWKMALAIVGIMVFFHFLSHGE